jgi:ribonuclease P protein subunit POP4
MTRADYHGAMLRVTKSKSASYVGHKGIVLKETKNTFKIVTEKNQFKSEVLHTRFFCFLNTTFFSAIPKANSEFVIEIDKYAIVLYGNNICHKPAARSSRKFKQQPSIAI